MKMLSGFRFRCITPWWCTNESPVRSWRNLTLMSTSLSQVAWASSLLYHVVKLSWTNSVHITARLPRISEPKCLMMFGCCNFPNSAASRKNDVGMPSSLPAFVSSRSTTRSRTASPVPSLRHRKSRPLERRSTTFSDSKSWSTRRTCLRKIAHSSLLWAVSRQTLQTGAAFSTRSLTLSRLNTSRSRLPGCRSARTRDAVKPSSLQEIGFTGSMTAAPGSSAWLCFRRFVGDKTAVLSEILCSGLR
mmetsp:Transcript_93434/g.264538  ORF Transcript_93434/g.264538 Transcript_93434/m.264538 type:complete len:246 (+) Transcript_93434:2036-2773(+)